LTIKWSFSGLKDFVTCPRQYYEVKVAQNFTKRVSEQMTYGTAVHKALEDYVKDGSPLPKNYERYKKYVDPLLQIAGDRYPEYQMALDIEKKPCGFHAQEYWVRGIVDLMIVDGSKAFIVDYKTGSARNPDPNQLKLMALMAYAHFPSVEKIKASLMFIAHNTLVFEEYDRADQDKLWATFDADLNRMQFAYANNLWPENPNFFCRKWCPVTTCRFNGDR
jgi:CRISPR/Cas system-associated exonuclease Cas4 (RecB family)